MDFSSLIPLMCLLNNKSFFILTSFFLYIHQDDEINIREYLNNLNINYIIVCYNDNKLENYNIIIL